MTEQEKCKNDYLRLKADLGKIPTAEQVRRHIGQHRLEMAFGSKALSKLRLACGDEATTFGVPKTPLESIMEQWGVLARENLQNGISQLPTPADWKFKRCKPSLSALRTSHSLQWSAVSGEFLNHAASKPEWNDVVEFVRHLIGRSKSRSTAVKNKAIGFRATKNQKAFEKVAETIDKWVPRMRRSNEESYKVELRLYLESQLGIVREEKGDSNPDILVHGSILVEVKKSPDLADYDRLFGQLARHLAENGSAVAVICDVKRQDQYDDFISMVKKIYETLGYQVLVLQK